MKNAFKISVTMAVYNASDYIKEAMDSILNQTIGFENVQVVMVDDCSTDGSAEKCEEYAEQYPDNIIFIKNETNSGVAVTRNKALKQCQGELTTSIDPDDYVDLNLFENAYNYFQQVKDCVDMVEVPLHFFEGSNDYHLNSKYRFAATRIIDIEQEYYSICLNTCGAFVDTKLLQMYGYPETLNVDSEDTFLITQAIMRKRRYAVLKAGGEYHYRKRLSNNSLTQTNGEKKEWYIDKVDNFFMPLIQCYRNENSRLPRYLQFLFRYSLQWNFKYNSGNRNVLSVEETEEYLKKIQYVLNEIDDDILLNRGGDKKLDSNIHLLNALLKAKYGSNAPYSYLYKKENMYMAVNDDIIYSLTDHGINISNINFCENKMYIGGFYTNPFINAGLKLEVEINGEPCSFQSVTSTLYSPKYFGRESCQAVEFWLCVELSESIDIKMFLTNGKVRYLAPLITNKSPYNKIYTKCSKSYYIYKDKQLKIGKKVLYIREVSAKDKVKCEKAYLRELLFGKKLLRKKCTNINAVLLRLAYWLIKPYMKKRKVWLFMDRMNKGGDNAEFLFRYAIKQNDGIDKFFVVCKDTGTYKRLKNEHLPVLAKGSIWHRLMFLYSEKFITSQMDVIYMNDFRGIEIFFRDLFNFDYIHIQHGLCWQNLEHLLNPNVENMKMITAVAWNEVKNLQQERYAYFNKQVHPVGMARFDGLQGYKNEKKQIMICPTWRRDLVGRLLPSGSREYSEKFKQSLFFHMYNELLSDSQLIDSIVDRGYQILFVLHPNLQQQRGDFKIDSRVIFPNAQEVDYDFYLKESKIMVTDYSGIQFDFAYMKKPIIYFHDAQLQNHLVTSEFFNYVNDGFGEICTSVNELKNLIMKYVDNNATMDTKYQKRVEDFFIFHDFNHCKRIYSEILNYKMGE